MWTCPLCNQQFVNTNQVHSCNDKVLPDFLKGKSENTISLFWHFIYEYKRVGEVTIHPTKSMIAIIAIRFIDERSDVVFMLKGFK